MVDHIPSTELAEQIREAFTLMTEAPLHAHDEDAPVPEEEHCCVCLWQARLNAWYERNQEILDGK